MAQNMMEHIAKALGKDPTEVRLLNMAEVHRNMLEPMIEELSNNADFESRKKIIQAFNNVRKVIFSNKNSNLITNRNSVTVIQ